MLYLHVLLIFYILNWTKHKFKYLCVSIDFFNQSVTYLKYSGMSLVCPNLQRYYLLTLYINSLLHLNQSILPCIFSIRIWSSLVLDYLSDILFF